MAQQTGGTERIWAFPSIDVILEWTELNWTELNWTVFWLLCLFRSCICTYHAMPKTYRHSQAGVVRYQKSETERGPERSCRINTQGSSLALEIRNISTTTKTWVTYGNSHLACVELQGTASSGGVYVPCIYMHARWELPYATQVFVVVIALRILSTN